jgi:hypothetical protein
MQPGITSCFTHTKATAPAGYKGRHLCYWGLSDKPGSKDTRPQVSINFSRHCTGWVVGTVLYRFNSEPHLVSSPSQGLQDRRLWP